MPKSGGRALVNIADKSLVIPVIIVFQSGLLLVVVANAGITDETTRKAAAKAAKVSAFAFLIRAKKEQRLFLNFSMVKTSINIFLKL